MGYNDSLDKYMKKRQNEFRKDYLQLIMESRRLSKKKRLNRLLDLREKYMDLIIFKHVNKKPEPKYLKLVRIDKDLKVRTYYKRNKNYKKRS